jgi:hypothetical protein
VFHDIRNEAANWKQVAQSIALVVEEKKERSGSWKARGVVYMIYSHDVLITKYASFHNTPGLISIHPRLAH